MTLPVACEVCDRPDTDTVVQGFALHAKCAPAGWVESDRVHKAFMVKVRALAKARRSRWGRWSS